MNTWALSWFQETRAFFFFFLQLVELPDHVTDVAVPAVCELCLHHNRSSAAVVEREPFRKKQCALTLGV